MCPHQELNLDLRFRKPPFYPLNYEGLDLEHLVLYCRFYWQCLSIVVQLNSMQNQKNQMSKDQIDSQLETLNSEPILLKQQKLNKLLVIILVILFLAAIFIFIFIYLHFKAKSLTQQSGNNRTMVGEISNTPTPVMSMAPLSIFTDKYEFGSKIEQEFDKII